MSRLVINDLVLPVVIRILGRNGVNVPSYADIRDDTLLNYLEEECAKNFGIRGQAGDCPDLRRALDEAIARDPQGFEEYIKIVLNRYIALRVDLAKSVKVTDEQKARVIKQIICGEGSGSNDDLSPPDRFTEFRKRQKKNPLYRWVKEN